MNEDDIVEKLVADLRAVVSSWDKRDVRTAGGDQEPDPPEIILEWNTRRLADYNGHNAFGHYTRDQNGDATGIEYHAYWLFNADFVVRYYDENARDERVDSIHEAFLPYEYDASDFHADTAEWELGNASPRQNPILEQDWYEVGMNATFVYLKRATETKDALETVNKSTDIDDSLDSGPSLS